MSSLAAQSANNITGPVVLFILAGLSLAVCLKLGVFRKASTTIDRRMSPDDSPYILLWIMFLGFFLSQAAGSFAMSFSHDDGLTKILGSAVGNAVGFIVIGTANVILRSTGWRKIGLSIRGIIAAVPWAILSLLLILPLIYVAGMSASFVWSRFGLVLPDAHLILKELHTSKDTTTRLLLIVMATVLAPLYEELLFRGLLQTIFVRSIGSTWRAIVYTSIIFAAVHGEFIFVFPLFVLAMGLGYVYERTGNLWATIVTHALFNAVQIVLFLNFR